LILLALIVGCGDGEVAERPQAPAQSDPVASVVDTAAPADTGVPPGLAPVAIDRDEPRAPVQPPRESPAQTPAETPPATPSREPDPTPASEQQQDDGAAILRRAATAYADVRSMQADFVMQFNNPLLRQQTTSRGTIYQQRPDRIALRFTDPAGDVILSDGEYFYVYQPSVDAQQATRTPASPGAGGGVDLQAQFIGNPVERFEYTLHGTESVGGRDANVMTLVPRERAEYRSLKVWFDARDSIARRFEITEHNGSTRRFDLSNLRLNPTIPADVFRFTPPAGVRIVNVG